MMNFLEGAVSKIGKSGIVSMWEKGERNLVGWGMSKFSGIQAKKLIAGGAAAADVRAGFRMASRDFGAAYTAYGNTKAGQNILKAAPYVMGGVAALHGIGAVRHTRDHRYGRAALSTAFAGAAALSAMTSRNTFTRMADAARMGMLVAARNAGRL